MYPVYEFNERSSNHFAEASNPPPRIVNFLVSDLSFDVGGTISVGEPLKDVVSLQHPFTTLEEYVDEFEDINNAAILFYLRTPAVWQDSQELRLETANSHDFGIDIPKIVRSFSSGKTQELENKCLDDLGPNILGRAIGIWIFTGDLERAKDFVAFEESKLNLQEKCQIEKSMRTFWTEFLYVAQDHIRQHLPSPLVRATERRKRVLEGLDAISDIAAELKKIEQEQHDELNNLFPKLVRLKNSLPDEQNYPSNEAICRIAMTNPEAAAEFVHQISQHFPFIQMYDQISKELPERIATRFLAAFERLLNAPIEDSTRNPHWFVRTDIPRR